LQVILQEEWEHRFARDLDEIEAMHNARAGAPGN